MADSATVRRIQIAASLVALQALALVLLAAVELVNLNPERPSVAVTTAVFYALFAAGLLFAARGLLRQRSWSRSPVVLNQLITLGVGWSFRGGDTVWVTAVLFGWAAVVLVLVLHPATTTALYGHRGGRDENEPSAQP
ncbi:MAG: hypothetical protein H0T17_03665 [Propionibacteriales bacterium]|nr:hypothetical protein [Propionibacteriales bacterium]